MKYDVIIVGAGIAGLTTAIYLRRAEKTVLICEKKLYGGQIINATGIENWPGEPGISGKELMDKIYHQANNLGAKLVYEDVMEINKHKASFLIKTDETEYEAKAVVLAMGTEPRKMSDKQIESAGKRAISYCATCDGALYKDKPVVVVGSGNTAKHEIDYLKNIASEVYQIHHDDPIPKEAEAVFVAIGRIPNTDFLSGLVDLDKKRYIVAGEDCKTSLKGVFAVGDCRTKTVRQLVNAAGDGAVAAEAVIDYLK